LDAANISSGELTEFIPFFTKISIKEF